ncbi:ferritin family protein [Rhizobium laguerreae]|uniref:ferritin-like domain-containing protein n=1 Tax=Rhizobium laguerreae TaxID=1076926 RepID=UPI001C90DA67|nr:ferritin family protein [Rhizobium laguerreae]MBY3102281.1 ferritin family protein [Rhizobium laguerreae]
MPSVNREPWELSTLEDLLSLAAQMEQEAIDGYVALADRMREMRRPDLAEIFESLVIEEKSHLAKVVDWQEAGPRPNRQVVGGNREELFDDEGAGTVAPDMLSAYRAFSMAVRNEERAFVFWTYVSAHAQSDEIKSASERMAREELGHVAKLRRERRLAFHSERDKMLTIGAVDIAPLEQRLALHVQSIAADASGGESRELQSLAQQCSERAESLRKSPFVSASLSLRSSSSAIERLMPLCETLAECYLDIGATATSDEEANRSNSFAGQLIDCLRMLRSLPPSYLSGDDV